jgi:hypothetical protein
MEINYAEENAFMTVEDYQRIVARIKKKRFLYQEWLEPDEYIDDTVDSIKYVFSTFKEPIVVEADKKPVRWLSDFIND